VEAVAGDQGAFWAKWCEAVRSGLAKGGMGSERSCGESDGDVGGVGKSGRSGSVRWGEEGKHWSYVRHVKAWRKG
jgi:hypothetical protein